jgi:hypothetical protein
MTDTELDLDSALDDARERATSAASWLFDGNNTPAAALRFIYLDDEGDPRVHDEFPTPDVLSGEWAEGPFIRDVLEMVEGIDPDDVDPDDEQEIVDAYIQAYDEQFHVAARDEALRWVDATMPAEYREHFDGRGVYVRFPSDHPDQARKMSVSDLFAEITEAINRYGQHIESGAVSVSYDCYECPCEQGHHHGVCDDCGPEWVQVTYCVAEYPDATIRVEFTSDHDLILWGESA